MITFAFQRALCYRIEMHLSSAKKKKKEKQQKEPDKYTI